MRWTFLLCRAAPAPACRAARCRPATACCCRSPNSCACCASIRVARVAVVQPGVRNAAISDVAAPFGLYYAPDPSSQIACSIGGNVAENSGGVHCLKYGLTVHNVLRVRGYTIEGEAVDFGSEALDAPGYDLLALAIGSEGLLAVTTEVTVKLLPKPETARVIMASFDDVEKAGDAVAAVIAAGIIPAGLEMMDQPATARRRAVRARRLRPRGRGDPAVRVRRQRRGSRGRDRAHEGGAARRRARRASPCRATRPSGCASGPGARRRFPRSGRISPDYYCMDGTIPKKRLGEVLNFIGAMEKKYGLRCPNVFHAGDGNLHPLILFDANDAGPARSAPRHSPPRCWRNASRSAAPSPASTAWAWRRSTRCACSSATPSWRLFHAIKRAFDPKGLLNPGKAVPDARALRRVRPQARACRQARAVPDCRGFEFLSSDDSKAISEKSRPPPAASVRCASAAAAARISTATRRRASCSIRAAMPASSTTNRPSW